MTLKRISYVPFILKWVAPIFIFIILTVALVAALIDDAGQWWAAAIVAAVLMLSILSFKFFVWDLMDEVFDGGDHLVFSKSGIEQKVMLTDIESVRYVSYISPRRMTVTTRKSGKLGKTLVFTPTASFNQLMPFTTPAAVQELIDRIHAARRG